MLYIAINYHMVGNADQQTLRSLLICVCIKLYDVRQIKPPAENNHPCCKRHCNSCSLKMKSNIQILFCIVPHSISLNGIWEFITFCLMTKWTHILNIILKYSGTPQLVMYWGKDAGILASYFCTCSTE